MALRLAVESVKEFFGDSFLGAAALGFA